jgi:hypothetical protein
MSGSGCWAPNLRSCTPIGAVKTPPVPKKASPDHYRGDLRANARGPRIRCAQCCPLLPTAISRKRGLKGAGSDQAHHLARVTVDRRLKDRCANPADKFGFEEGGAFNWRLAAYINRGWWADWCREFASAVRLRQRLFRPLQLQSNVRHNPCRDPDRTARPPASPTRRSTPRRSPAFVGDPWPAELCGVDIHG